MYYYRIYLHTLWFKCCGIKCVIDANQAITDGSNIFSAGDDFSIQYHSWRLSNSFGGANVVVAQNGLISNKITIRESDDTYSDFMVKIDF